MQRHSSQKKNTEESGKQIRGKNKIAFVSIGIILVMIIITTGSLLFFKTQLMHTAQKEISQAKRNYDNYYVMINSDNNSSFWQSVFQGATEQAEATNTYVEVLGENLSVDYSEAEQMEIAIESKVDGIIVEANESLQMRKLIDEAVTAGIPVVTALGDNTSSTRQSYVGISSYNLGREYGKQVNSIADSIYGAQEQTDNMMTNINPLQVLVLINANAEDSSQNIVFSGIQEAVENQSDYSGKINLEAKAINTEGAFAAEESIRNIFMTEEQPPDIIICLNELNTTCVYQAVVDYNQVGQINIIGYYNSETILKAIDRSVIYSTISVDTKQMGAYCVDALNEYGESGYVSEYYAVDTTLINGDNVRNYLGGDADEE
ncbi:MAG: substrate-binding domain-containing protein [Lachnospiraceae bacterium]|nr:substrate-binding domain-containing protein [Lachnospiraceae bacterium]